MQEPLSLAVGSHFRIVHDQFPQFDQPIRIEAKHQYFADQHTWYEYEFIWKGDTCFLTIEDTYIYLVLKPIKRRDVGIRRSWVSQNNLPDVLTYEDQVYHLVENGPADFHEDLRRMPEKLHYYDYQHGQAYITVEIWEDGSLQLFHSFRLPLADLITS